MSEATAAYHSLIPDDGHPLLGAVGALGNQGEVVLPHGLLSSVESTMGTASDLEVTAERKTYNPALKYPYNTVTSPTVGRILWLTLHQPLGSPFDITFIPLRLSRWPGCCIWNSHPAQCQDANSLFTSANLS